MSYAKFLDDLDMLYRERKKNGITEKMPMEEADGIVRDQWLKAGKYDDLIKFIHKNWDSGNCDEFIEPFEKVLILQNDLKRYKLLWEKIIKIRINDLWRDYKVFRKANPIFDINNIIAIDVSKFDMYSTKSYEDINIVIAFRRQFVLDGLNKYLKGLEKLKDKQEMENIKILVEQIKYLKRSPKTSKQT